MLNTLTRTLTLTDAFESDMRAALASNGSTGSPRSKVMGVFTSLSLDHWQAIRVLFAHGQAISALALLRCQFEATVKAFWFHFAATDEKVDRFGNAQASEEGLLKEPSSKTIAEMIKAMTEHAPAQVVRQLKEFNDSSLKPLHSFVHGGHYAAVATVLGKRAVPEDHLVMMLRQSNGLAAMIAMLSSVESGDAVLVQRVIQVQLTHLPCLPETIQPKT